MRFWLLFFTASSSIIGLYIVNWVQRPVIDLCDLEKCPFCYGRDLCWTFKAGLIKLTFDTWIDVFYNCISVKNLYVGHYRDVKVVLKKLGHVSELNDFDRRNVAWLSNANSQRLVSDLLTQSSRPGEIKQFKTCDSSVSKLFLNKLVRKFEWAEIWFMAHVSAEPLVLTVFEYAEGWPFPILYGACGRVTVEKHCGPTLNSFEAADWHVRAYLALQILKASKDLTLRHRDFRLYLTDVSPDNIAVSDDLTVFFVDVENAILAGKISDYTQVHRSEHIDEDDNFAYFEKSICQSSISDHNFYAICRLLLSKSAPWPMMAGGLLHSSPDNVKIQYGDLFDLVETCVDPGAETNRFEVVDRIILLLENYLERNPIKNDL